MKLKLTANGIADYFNAMLDRTKLVSGWLNRVAYPKILKAQKVRWQTAGASEGSAWAPLTNESYKKSKLKKFAQFPGAGRKLLVATGRLAFSLTLDESLRSPLSRQSDHAKLVKGNELIIESFVPYGQYVNEARDISTLGENTLEELADGLHDYIVNGNTRRLE